MRPINLKIKGINSYVSEQEVCFDKLSETNLFGIFGETGSGKTTILDAIIIALYGSSDRETIQNIINVNSTNAYIKFEFEIVSPVETKKYLVSREYKVRKSGVKSEAILLDLKTNQVLAEMTDKVNEKEDLVFYEVETPAEVEVENTEAEVSETEVETKEEESSQE